MRERLVELIGAKICEDYSPTCNEWQPHSCEKCYANSCRIGDLADYLLENEVVEVRHGEWIEWWDDNYLTFCHKCSECGRYPLTKEETMHDEVLSKYCPNCGAKMDKGEEENAEIIYSK